MVDDLTEFGLQRLFNPDNTDFLPIEEQLKFYKQRDLSKSKFYKTAARIWGTSGRSRKRLIIAPPMETFTSPTTVRLKPLEPQRCKGDNEQRALTNTEKLKHHEEELEIKAKTLRTWYEERKELRQSLENLGLSESWLASKPDKSPLEQNLYLKMLGKSHEVLPKHLRPLEDQDDMILPDFSSEFSSFTSKGPRSLSSKMSKHHEDKITSPEGLTVESPAFLLPPPEALSIILKHLRDERIRLIDLFRRADKDKNWMISKSEFRNCIKDAKIPLSDYLLELLMDSLDSDMNDQLDYRELAKGIKDYQLEERKRKKELMESSGSSITKEFERMISCQSMKSIGGQSSRSVSRQSDVRIVSAASQRSQVSIAASQRSQVSIVASQASLDSLDVPKIDITEQVSLCPDDLILKRKKEKVFNRHAKLSSAGKQRVLYGDTKNVKTGNKAVDSHSMCSTLGGEIGDTVDQHRQERLEEYHRIVKMCQDRNVALSAQLLERALLMPGDKPVSRLKKKIAQPGCHLVSRHFADSPTRSKTPIEVKHSDTIHRDKTGQLLMEAKHAYPQKRYVEPQTTMVHLSTGKAFISTKVKCWLTFEEYENLTRDLQKRYVVFNDTVDANAFWPGQLLDKLRLCMDEQDSASGPATVYQSTKQAKPTNSGYNNNLQTWPTDSGYIQFGDITQNKIYTLDSK